MNFRTELHLAPSDRKLSVASNVVTVGSCFSEVIGKQLEKYKVNTLTNPFGTIFNPLSACKLLQACCGLDVELANAFVERDGRWYSYDFHSSFSAETEEALYELLDEVVVKTRRFLKQADLLIITLGTANVFRLNITGETVANCHKMPANNFEKEMLNPEEIIAAVAETQSMLRELNPNLRMVLSVSPVRHLKDTLELNSVSKSILRLATHYITQQLSEIYYFPAYELLLDDLRDYRFYKDDMLHPSEMAEQYIWQKFNQVYFDEAFLEFTSEWDKVMRAMQHKPFQLATEAHQNFVQTMLQKLEKLKTSVNTDSEIAYFQSQIVELPKAVEPKDEEENDEEAAETLSKNVPVAEEDPDDLPEIDDEIIESKYPARKVKKAAKIAKRDLFKTEPTSENQPAALTAAAPEAETILNETPEEKKRRKKKERRKKKKTPQNLGAESIPESQASAESNTAPGVPSEPISAPETSTIVGIPAADKKSKKSKKRKLQQALKGAEIVETGSGYLAESKPEITTELPVDETPRPIIFSKYYLEQLEKEKAAQASGFTETPAIASVNEETILQPEVINTLPEAALNTNLAATVSEVPAPAKKRGGKTKKTAQTETTSEQLVSEDVALPVTSQAQLVPENAENITDQSDSQNQALPFYAEIQSNPKPQNGKNQNKRSSKTSKNVVTPDSESLAPVILPAIPETPMLPVKKERPVKAAKIRGSKKPEPQTQLPFIENIPADPEINKPEAKLPESKKTNPAPKATKPKKVKEPVTAEPVPTIAPILSEKALKAKKPSKKVVAAKITTVPEVVPEVVIVPPKKTKQKREPKKKASETPAVSKDVKPKAAKKLPAKKQKTPPAIED